MESDWYLSLRRRYEPERHRLVIAAESPPVSERYFYSADGSTSGPLFAAMMRQFKLSPPTKDAGLRKLQQRGWLLVDATYEPVNAMTPSSRELPLNYMLRVMRDESEPPKRRDRMAIAAAPYLHPKLQATQAQGAVRIEVIDLADSGTDGFLQKAPTGSRP